MNCNQKMESKTQETENYNKEIVSGTGAGIGKS